LKQGVARVSLDWHLCLDLPITCHRRVPPLSADKCVPWPDICRMPGHGTLVR